jgi:hypothetical protein
LIRKLIPTEPCRSCGAFVVWAITESGKRMPVDCEADIRGKLRLHIDNLGVVRVTHDPFSQTPHYRPHFATCPDAESWRKR